MLVLYRVYPVLCLISLSAGADDDPEAASYDGQGQDGQAAPTGEQGPDLVGQLTNMASGNLKGQSHKSYLLHLSHSYAEVFLEMVSILHRNQNVTTKIFGVIDTAESWFQKF